MQLIQTLAFAFIFSICLFFTRLTGPFPLIWIVYLIFVYRTRPPFWLTLGLSLLVDVVILKPLGLTAFWIGLILWIAPQIPVLLISRLILTLILSIVTLLLYGGRMMMLEPAMIISAVLLWGIIALLFRRVAIEEIG